MIQNPFGKVQIELGINIDQTPCGVVFGPEDIVWRREGGNLDTDALIHQHGQDPLPPLILLLKALIRGKTSDASAMDVGKRLRKAMASINGQRKGGRGGHGYNDALLEIAWLYFEELYECGLSTSQVIKLRPIVLCFVLKLRR